jgi:transcriptional regulator with PAS, ATPase and Fis domain
MKPRTGCCSPCAKPAVCGRWPRVFGAKAIYDFSDSIGSSPLLLKAIEHAEKAAESDVTTLILGESGTGKELFAQAIHNRGARSKKPFIVVNCGALPRDLVQSELFGYAEGAFTGASSHGKPGKFELADGGSIFLDEIGEMPLDAQISLLRLLQNGEVSRSGINPPATSMYE